MIGCMRRMQRFFDPKSRRCLVLAMDHGPADSTIPGMTHDQALMDMANALDVQCVVLNKGVARAFASRVDPETSLVIQLSAGTKHGVPTYNKSVVCSIPEALRLGADAVAMHVNIGNDLEDRMLEDLGRVTDEALELGLPVMAVLAAQGGSIVNELDPSLVAHCIRLGGELGADLVCTPYSGEPQSYARAVTTCPAPVLVAGGPPMAGLDTFLEFIGEALELGAAGVVAGRNVLQRENPAEALAKVAAVVHKPAS